MENIVVQILLWLLIGAIAGWAAGQVMRGAGFGLVGNIVVGIIGALIGGFVMSLVGLGAGGWLWTIVVAFIGAVILLAIIGMLKRA